MTGHSDTPEPVPDPHSNTGSSTTTIDTQADLEVTKTGTPDPVLAGRTLTYTVTVHNHGPSDAQNVKATDTLPAGVTFLATQGCGEDPTGVPVCTLGTIPAETSKSYEIRVRVDSSMPDGATITNTVTGQSDTPEPVPDPHPNLGTTTTTVTRETDLAIDKRDDGSDAVAGTNYTYTLEVTNYGPSDSTGATVTDTLPRRLDAGSSVQSDLQWRRERSANGDLYGRPARVGRHDHLHDHRVCACQRRNGDGDQYGSRASQ